MRKSFALALTLLGLFDSLYLLYSYTSSSRPMVCIGTGCDAVRASAYSSLWGVPVPVFGVAGYALLAIVIFAEPLFTAALARLARFVFLGMTGIGFLFSLYLDYLQAFVIHSYCAWCVASGIVMAALFALAIWNVVRAGPEPEPAVRLKCVQNLFAICVAGLLVGVPAFYLLMGRSGLAQAPPEAAANVPLELLVRPDSHAAGNPRAPLTVVEFGDFECPVCSRGEDAAREIRTRYARQIRFVFRQLPLTRIHPLAQKAAEAAECAGAQGKFWEMVEKIYSRQYDMGIEGLKRDAAELGLEQSRFNDCLTTGAMAGRVRRDAEDGRALGVRATPTYFVGQKKIEGVLTEAQFSQSIDEQLATIGTAPEEDGPGAVRATAAAKRPATKPAVTRSLPKQPAETVQAAAGNGSASAGFGQASSGSLATAPGAFAGGLPGAVPTGAFGGAQASGGACSEADAAKQQPTLIDTRELRRLLSSSSRPLLVDVRPASDFAAGRIPDAINLPADEMERRWNTLPRDRTIILYESGASGNICATSRAAGRVLLEHGFPFSQVKVYQDGLVGWEQAKAGTTR